MPSVDNRVVEMRFDNKDFESGVSESISSLDKLKRSLKMGDAADGFDEIGRAAESVTSKFSALGTIGDQILRNIGNEVYQLKNQFVGLIKSMSVDQVTAGWTKYGEKTASVQTILNATGKSIGEVNEYLDRLMKYSDETSFGFTDMTAALQTMTASGGDLDKLIPMLMGVGNATAYAGKSASEFSRVMYNLNQAYSLGYLGTMDWKSVQMAGVGSKQLKQALLDSARKLGTGDYDLNEFQTALTKKAFTTEVMEDAFGQFAKVTLEAERLWKEGQYETFTEAYRDLQDQFLGTGDAYDELAFKAAKAAQEAKSFNEAIDATKDAVSTGWMTTFEQIFGNYEETKEIWTWLAEELWDVFASGAEQRNAMFKEWHDSELGGYKDLWQAIQNFWDGLKGIGGKIKEAWQTIFPGLTADKLINATSKFLEWSEKFKAAFTPISETIEELESHAQGLRTFIDPVVAALQGTNPESFAEGIDAATDSVSRFARTLEVLDELEAAVWRGEYGVGWDRWNQLEEEGYSWQLVQNAVNETAGSMARFEIEEEDLETAVAILNDELEDTAEYTYDAGEAMEEMAEASQKTRNWLDDLRDVAGGFKSALDLLVEAGKLAVKYIVVPAWNFLVEVFKKGLAVIAPFSRAFSDFVAKLKETGIVSKNIENIRQWFRDLWSYLEKQENMKKFLGYWQDFKDWLSGIKEKSLNKITDFFDKLATTEIDLPSIEKIGGWIDRAVGSIDEFLGKVKEFGISFDKIKEFFTSLDFSDVTSFASSMANAISTFLTTLFTNKELKETGVNWLSSILQGIKEKAEQVDWSEVLNTVWKGLSGAVLLKLGLSVSNFFTTVGNIADGPAGLLDKLGRFLTGLTKSVSAFAVLEIAIAIGVLAASMLALSKVPSDRLPQIAVDLSAVILALSVLVSVFGKFKVFGDKINKTTSFNGGNVNATINVFNGLAAILFGFGIALAAITLALKTISKIPENDLKRAAIYIGQILLVFAMLMLALKSISLLGNKSSYNILHGNSFGKDMLSAAGAMAIMAIAISIMVPAISALAIVAKWDKADLTASILSLVVIIGAFAVLTAVAKTKDGNSSAILKTAFALAVIALAIDLMVPGILALTKIAKSDLGSYVAVMGSIIVLFGLMSIAFGILSSLSSSDTKKGAAAFAGMAVLLLSVGAFFKMIKGIKWKEIQTGTLFLAGVIVVLTALGALVGHFGLIAVGMVAVGAALLLFGAGIALVGAGALTFAKAIVLLKDSSADAKVVGKNLAAGIGSFFTELNNNMGPILAVVGKIVSAIIALLILKKSKIVETGANIVDAFGKSVTSSLGSNKLVLFAGIALLIGELLEYLGVKSDTVADSLIKGAALVINSLAVALRENKGVIFEATGNLMIAISELLANLTNELDIAIFGLAAEYNGHRIAKGHLFQDLIGNPLQTGLYDLFGKYTIDDKGRKILNLNADKEAIVELRESIHENVTGLVGDFNILKSAADSAKDSISVSGESIDKSLQGFADPALLGTEAESNMQKKADLLANSSFQAVLEAFDGKSWEEIGESIPEGISLGELGLKDLPVDSGKELVALLKEYFPSAEGLDINSPSHVAQEWGESIPEGLAVGMLNKTSNVVSAIRKLIDVIKSHGVSLGQNFDIGFANGISIYSILVTSEIQKLAKNIYNVAAKELDIHSPSKKGERLGMFWDRGLAGGIDNNADLIENSINKIAIVISHISDAINNDWDMSPVIRPVLDLSEIQNGQGRIGSILGTNQYGFSPNLTPSIMNAGAVSASVVELNSRGANAYESMALMQQRFDELSAQNQTMVSIMRQYMPYIPELANMQVVTDRGTLVGELAPMMNQKLGQIAAKERRR